MFFGDRGSTNHQVDFFQSSRLVAFPIIDLVVEALGAYESDRLVDRVILAPDERVPEPPQTHEDHVEAADERSDTPNLVEGDARKLTAPAKCCWEGTEESQERVTAVHATSVALEGILPDTVGTMSSRRFPHHIMEKNLQDKALRLPQNPLYPKTYPLTTGRFQPYKRNAKQTEPKAPPDVPWSLGSGAVDPGSSCRPPHPLPSLVLHPAPWRRPNSCLTSPNGAAASISLKHRNTRMLISGDLGSCCYLIICLDLMVFVLNTIHHYTFKAVLLTSICQHLAHFEKKIKSTRAWTMMVVGGEAEPRLRERSSRWVFHVPPMRVV